MTTKEKVVVVMKSRDEKVPCSKDSKEGKARVGREEDGRVSVVDVSREKRKEGGEGRAAIRSHSPKRAQLQEEMDSEGRSAVVGICNEYLVVGVALKQRPRWNGKESNPPLPRTDSARAGEDIEWQVCAFKVKQNNTKQVQDRNWLVCKS